MSRSRSKPQLSTPDVSISDPQDSAIDPDEGLPPASTRQLPADDISELAAQLRREVARLESVEEGSEEEDESFRRVIAYVKKSQAVTWRRVVESDLDAPAEALHELDSLLPFADRHFPELSTTAHCSMAIHQLLLGLQTADQALVKAQITARLRDRELSDIERGILGILVRSDYQLRRGQVHEQLPESIRPSVARVGQILVDLHHDGLLHRTEAVAQGNPNTAFYGLTLLGREVARSIGALGPAVELPKQPKLRRLEQHIDRLREAFRGNRVARGTFASFAHEIFSLAAYVLKAAHALEAAHQLELVQISPELASDLEALAQQALSWEPTKATGT